MTELLTIERSIDGITLSTARKLTQEEQAQYLPEYRERILVGTGNRIDLDYVTWQDMPQRPSDGEFNGCSNMAWIITQEEWDAYISMDKARSFAAAKETCVTEIAELEAHKEKAETQTNLPTREEAKRRMDAYNNLYNEGGEGYVPYIYSKEEYEAICRRLEVLKGETIK